MQLIKLVSVNLIIIIDSNIMVYCYCLVYGTHLLVSFSSSFVFGHKFTIYIRIGFTFRKHQIEVDGQRSWFNIILFVKSCIVFEQIFFVAPSFHLIFFRYVAHMLIKCAFFYLSKKQKHK